MSRAASADDDSLDREYNPRLRVPGFGAVFARWKNEAARARESADARLNLPYGPAAAERLDLFPAGRPASPLLVFLHGGYWRALDKDDFSWIAPAYVKAGVSVAVVNYGLMPGTPLPEIVGQVRRACVWLHDNAASLGVDPCRIVCSGHSAGAHLTAMMLATDWPKVVPGLPARLLSGAISISGVFDLEPLRRAPFLRDDLALDEAGARELSPVFLSWRNDVPLLRALGALESDEFHRQSRLMERAWPAACTGELIRVADHDHLSVCDAFATSHSPLFTAARSLIG